MISKVPDTDLKSTGFVITKELEMTHKSTGYGSRKYLPRSRKCRDGSQKCRWIGITYFFEKGTIFTNPAMF